MFDKAAGLVAQFYGNFCVEGRARIVCLNFGVEHRLVAVQVVAHQHVFYPQFLCKVQVDIAVNAAEAQIIDGVAEGRDVRVFGGIHHHDDGVLAGAQKFCDIREGTGISAAVLGDFLAVDIQLITRHHAVKHQNGAPAGVLLRNCQLAHVGGDHGCLLMTEAVVAQLFHCVRQIDFFKAFHRGVVNICHIKAGFEIPVQIQIELFAHSLFSFSEKCAPAHPLTEPVRPSTKLRCRTRNTTIMGSVAMARPIICTP